MSHIHIDIQNLSFGYEANQPILQHISLHAGEHESIGIIGANGVGRAGAGLHRVDSRGGNPRGGQNLAPPARKNRLCVSG